MEPNRNSRVENIIIELKCSLEWFNSRCKQEESVKLKTNHLKLWSLRSKKHTQQNKEKSGQRLRKLWNIIKQYMHHENFRSFKEKGRRKGQSLLESFPNLRKIMDLQVQES